MAELAAVAFDMDGLMFNTEELYQQVGRILLERRGHQLTQQLLDRMMGRQSHVALQVMIDMHQLDDTAEQLMEETAEVFPDILRRELRTLEGLEALLEALERHRVPKSICTSSSRRFARQILSQFEMTERFDFVLTGEDVERGKPAPDMYLLAADRWGVAAAEMLVLEDSAAGCQAAVAAGAFAVAVPGPHSADHAFPGAQWIANSLADPRIFAALGLADAPGHSH